MIRKILKLRIYFLILIITLPSTISLFLAGIPPTHDGEYHIVRFFQFDKVLRSGVLYPIWAPDLNYTYGSPLFLYVYPLPNYFSSLFHFLGATFTDSFKINLITATFLGAFAMYTYGKYKFGVWGGVLASVFYTYAPYHALDVYVRGSVGEVWALALFPVVLYLFDRGVKEKDINFSLLAGCVFSLVIFSHNILSVMFLLFLIFYSLFTFWESLFSKRIILFLATPFVSGFLLSSIFIIPAILEQKYVTGLKIFNIFDHFPEVYQLIIPSWGSGYSGVLNGSQMSFQIGVANITIVGIALYGIMRKKIVKLQKYYILFFLFVFLAAIFLITPNSKFVYQSLTFMQLFQFPWRFLSLVIFSVSILAGGITLFYKSKPLYISLILLVFLTSFSYHKAPYQLERGDAYYTLNESFIYGTNSIGNAFQTKWFSQQEKKPESKAFLSKDKKNIDPEFHSAVMQKYNIQLDLPQEIIFNTSYFPGWEANVNDKKIIVVNRDGLIAVPLPEGKHSVTIYFTDTKTRQLAKTFSIFTFIFVLLFLLRKFATIKS